SNSFLLSLGINAQAVTEFLKERGLLVRNRSASVAPPGGIEKDQPTQADPLWGMVRVSTGSEDENQRLLELLDEFNSGYALLFDLDGTLVDTSTSFDATVDELVFRYSGGRLAPDELNCLRAEGGFNDDWVAAQELLRRRGIEVDFGKLSDEAFELYLSMAAANETAFFDEGLLQKAALKHPLFIVTGRTRREYEPVWASRLDASFKRVYCLDDLPDARPKPAPDFLLRARSDYRIRDGIYVGNSVDDMQAARQAGFYAIGVCTNLSAATLRESGADITVQNVNEIIEVLSL
ncbi:MAG TPA: HAD hydrolase-like protein, partial [Candidatus Obscuribacter sp.]|nr:HAD hydrolase-like protein [Candidatus Obscuribacter sp.]